MARDSNYSDSPTYGWDTVFAINVGKINEAVHSVTKDKIPPDFSYTGYVNDFKSDVRLDGVYETWSVWPGGSAQLLKLALPLRSGKLTVVKNGNSVQFNDLLCIASVELDFFEQTNIRQTKGINYHLKLKTAGRTDGKKAIADVYIQPKNPNDQLDSDIATYLPPLLEDWLNGHPDVFEYVFAEVTLNDFIDQDDFWWTKPTSIAYAYAERDDAGKKFVPGSGVLGVLCMTENRNTDNVTFNVSVNAIPDGADAAFLVNKSRILECLVLPNLCKAYDGVKSDDFELSHDGNTIALKDDKHISFVLKKDDGSAYTDKDGKQITGKVESLSVEISPQNRMLMRATSSAPVSPGFTAYTKSVHTYGVELETRADGKQSLVYKSTDTNELNQWAQEDNSHAVSTIQGVVTMVGLIAGAIVATVTDGLGMIVALTIIGIVSSSALWIPPLIMAVGTDKAPDLGALLDTIHAHINWTGGNTMKLTGAGLNDCLQLSGDFQPKEPESTQTKLTY